MFKQFSKKFNSVYNKVMRSTAPKGNPSSSKFNGAVLKSSAAPPSAVASAEQDSVAEILKRLDWRLRVLENGAKKIGFEEIHSTLQTHSQQIKNCEKFVNRYEIRVGTLDKRIDDLEKKTSSA